MISLENSDLREIIKNYCLENRINPEVYINNKVFKVEELIKDIQLATE